MKTSHLLIERFLSKSESILYFVVRGDVLISANKFTKHLFSLNELDKIKGHFDLKLYNQREKDGEFFNLIIRHHLIKQSIHGIGVKDEGEIHVIAEFDEKTELIAKMDNMNLELSNLTRDISKANRDLKQKNEVITELMNQDPLTKLSNRRHLFEKFEVISKKYNNDKIDNVIAVITDIDRFKEVNDTFGHDVGDEVLIIFADLITSFTRNEDVRVRFGGDEFFILFVDTPIEVVLNRVNELIEAFSLVLPQLKHIFSASFGIVKMRKNDDLVNLIKMSDEALYQSKQNGKAKYTLFNRN